CSRPITRTKRRIASCSNAWESSRNRRRPPSRKERAASVSPPCRNTQLDEYSLDSRAVRRAFDRASERYREHAIVQAEIRARLIERLDLVTLQPARVLDLGAASGASTRQLKRRYPKARIIALDLSHRMLVQARSESTRLNSSHVKI